MATLIAKCSGCGKEVPMEIDTTEEKLIGNVMKEGTTCDACTLLNQNDECCFGRSMMELEVPKFITDELVKQAVKSLNYFEALKRPLPKGTTLKIRRYKPLALPTETMFTEGAPAKPYPKLEYDEVEYCCIGARITEGRKHGTECPREEDK